MSITWSEQARRDLREIRDFIARDSERHAGLQVERLITRVERAAVMPSRGHPVHEVAGEAGLREVHEGNYRVIYRIHGDRFQVVTIVHMKQHLPPERLD